MPTNTPGGGAAGSSTTVGGIPNISGTPDPFGINIPGANTPDPTGVEIPNTGQGLGAGFTAAGLWSFLGINPNQLRALVIRAGEIGLGIAVGAVGVAVILNGTKGGAAVGSAAKGAALGLVAGPEGAAAGAVAGAAKAVTE